MNEAFEASEIESGDDLGEFVEIGRYSAFNNFQTGIILDTQVGDSSATVQFSPREALALADLIHLHRAELETAGDTQMEDLAKESRQVALSGPSPVPRPLPASQ